MKNRIIALIGLIICSIGAFSQNRPYPITDTVTVIGYHIMQFNKGDLKEKFINEERKKANESFEIPIDTEFYPYYFTIKLNNNNVLEKEQIASFVALQPNYKNTEIYKFLPTKHNLQVDSILSLYNIKYDVDRVAKYPPNKTYYQLLGKENYLFSIYAVVGKAVKVPVKMDWNVVLANNWEITPTYINKQIPAFYIYYFYDFEFRSISENNQIAGFTLWHNN